MPTHCLVAICMHNHNFGKKWSTCATVQLPGVGVYLWASTLNNLPQKALHNLKYCLVELIVVRPLVTWWSPSLPLITHTHCQLTQSNSRTHALTLQPVDQVPYHATSDVVRVIVHEVFWVCTLCKSLGFEPVSSPWLTTRRCSAGYHNCLRYPLCGPLTLWSLKQGRIHNESLH